MPDRREKIASDFSGSEGALKESVTTSVALDQRVISAMQRPGTAPEVFVVGCLAGLFARLLNQSTVTLSCSGKSIQLSVDVAAPFQELLIHAETQLESAEAAASGETQATPDAALRMVSDYRLPDALLNEKTPTFLIHLSDNEGELALVAPDWQGDRATRTLGYLSQFMESAARNPQQATGTLRLLSEVAALERYRDLNRTAVPLPKATVLDFFAAQAHAFAESDAVRFADSQISYAQLDRESTALAGLLIARGADQCHPVAVCVQRSERAAVMQLAALKAGSYFVPLDPTHPKQRLLDVLEECAPAVVIVSAHTRDIFADSSVPLFELPPDLTLEGKPSARIASAGDKAYMIYTSGTTGKPKGVMITHGALANFILAMRGQPGLAHGDRLLAVATFSFDMSILDMFLPLSSGATLVIASESAAKDPWELASLLEKHDITCMQATPVTWRMLLSSGYTGSEKLKMLVGGEALSRDLASELAQLGRELWNCYGPTETTVYSSVLRIRPGTGPITVGPPMANTVFYVADPVGQLLPPELAGELYIGGAGVAIGYFERPDLNRERFVADPWTTSSGAGVLSPTLFRTGDQVRLSSNGKNEFEFFGRLDHQVKLRGYRIELGEIEVALRSHASIADAAVLLREDEPDEPWLVGYVTPVSGQEAAKPEDLLDFAGRSLPSYMLPSRIVALAKLPLTGSGKVDKRALGALPAPSDTTEGVHRASPADTSLNELEASLLSIFQETLRLKSFGPDDNFFEHGGYSMLAIRLFAKIRSSLHRQLPITVLFDAPTVRKLAGLMRSGERLHALVPIRPAGTEAPFFLVHSYLLYGAADTMVETNRPVYGLRERSTSTGGIDLQRCVADYAEAIQRAWPTGVIHLGGWCAAATLTVELARRLMVQGRQIGMLALFDAEAPGFLPLPPTGSRRMARLRAARKFHLGRMRGMSLSERTRYVTGRLLQFPLNFTETLYLRHYASIERWQHSLRWLPSVLFYNRFTQIVQLQPDHIETLDIRIQLFRARDVTVIEGSDEALGWESIARRGVEVSFIPGHHESMFLDPNLDILRDKFQASMQAIEKEVAGR